MVGSDKERPRAARLAGLLDDGKAAEAQGFASFWIPQVPGYLDAMTAVALLAQRAYGGRYQLYVLTNALMRGREPGCDP